MGLTATFSSGNHGGQRAVGWHCTSWRKKRLSTKNFISSKSRYKLKEFTASRHSLEEILVLEAEVKGMCT